MEKKIIINNYKTLKGGDMATMSNFSHGEGVVPANVRATMLNKKTH